MSPVVDRLVELRRHLDHLREIRPQISRPDDLQQNLTLHNDVLFSLLVVCQSIIDIASELSARRKLRFGDYREAITNLGAFQEFSPDLVGELQRLPGFRNVLIHEYVRLDLGRAVEALDNLGPAWEFLDAVRRIEEGT